MTFEVLQHFGVTLLPDEQCCSSPLLRTGFREDAEKIMEHNLEQIRNVGAHTLITGCAGCYTTLKNNYPEELRVISLPEFLAEHLEELNLKRLDLSVHIMTPATWAGIIRSMMLPEKLFRQSAILRK